MTEGAVEAVHAQAPLIMPPKRTLILSRPLTSRRLRLALAFPSPVYQIPGEGMEKTDVAGSLPSVFESDTHKPNAAATPSRLGSLIHRATSTPPAPFSLLQR